MQEINKAGKMINIKGKDYLFHMGEDAEHFFILLSGQINLELETPGNKTHTIQSLKPGDILGWSWLFPPNAWNYDAYAVKDSELLAIKGSELLALMEDDPVGGYQLMKCFSRMMVDRLRATRIQMLDLYGGRK
jgi:CRP-like cAMP-binding protein